MGVGMPGTIYLNDFGGHIYSAFGQIGYHVGSSLDNKAGWRDVDVRVLIDDDQYKELYGNPDNPHANRAWVSTVLAWTAFGRALTGLPIDFQIQPCRWANEKFKGGNRGALLSQRSSLNPSSKSVFLDAFRRMSTPPEATEEP